MNEAAAIELAKSYATACGVPWNCIYGARKERAWWLFGVRSYDFDIDTGDGSAEVTVSFAFYNSRGIHRFEYNPNDPKKFLLPLWLAFPGFTAWTIGWGMSYGERYKYQWHAWYRNLDDSAKAEYKRRYPAPVEDGRDWDQFYDMVADKPSDGSIPDMIMGRV